MKFSLENSIFLLVFLVACSTQTSYKKSSSTPVKKPSQSLEKFDSTRLQEGNREWCQGHKGLAYEHWTWVLQFDGDSEASKEAQKFVNWTHSNPEKISAEIGCN